MEEAVLALGIVRGKVDERAFLCEGENLADGLMGDRYVGADSINLAGEEELLVVAGVSGEEVGR